MDVLTVWRRERRSMSVFCTSMLWNLVRHHSVSLGGAWRGKCPFGADFGTLTKVSRFTIRKKVLNTDRAAFVGKKSAIQLRHKMCRISF